MQMDSGANCQCVDVSAISNIINSLKMSLVASCSHETKTGFFILQLSRTHVAPQRELLMQSSLSRLKIFLHMLNKSNTSVKRDLSWRERDIATVCLKTGQVHPSVVRSLEPLLHFEFVFRFMCLHYCLGDTKRLQCLFKGWFCNSNLVIIRGVV